MKLNVIIIFIAILCLANTCTEKDVSKPDSTLKILNNSNDTLFYYIEYRAIGDTLLPDFSIFPDEQAKELNTIEPLSTKEDNDAFVKAFDRLENKVLMLFIFDKEVVDNVPWDTIREEYMVLKRYDLSLQDLEGNNWTVAYP